jgi:ring-1,2-phenylacetyl-CoA epoxidase subunit PaaE
VVDLGLVREVIEHDDGLEIVLTPTYSGCPATEVIEQSVLDAIAVAGLGPARVTMRRAPPGAVTGSAPMANASCSTTALHRPARYSPMARCRSASSVVAGGRALSALRQRAYRAPFRLRLHCLQVVASLPRLSRTLRTFQADMSVLFHDLRVKSIEPDTAEASILSFEVPPELRETFGFTQGQYLTLRANIDGQDLRRSYSICAGVDDGELRVGVRRVKGGAFSNWINEHLRPGDTISVMAPQGRFFVPIEAAAKRHHVGIAGGSGITPILSIMKTVLAREPLSRFTLIYGNRMLRSTMFKEELEDLKNRYMTRLSLQHVFSDEPTDSPINMGVMNREKIGEFLATVVPALTIDHVYVCGPFQMNDEAEAALLAAGVPEAAIHIERFGVALPAGAPVGAVVHEAQPGDAEQARVFIVRDGMQRDFEFRKDQPSILDAASAAGLEVPFSCTSGVCGTCRCKVVEGEVRMERNFALDKAEVAAGFVLACQAHPLTERVVLSFDER